jgi:hypothetical protein
MNRKHTTGVSNFGSLRVGNQQQSNNLARSLVSACIVQWVHALIINATSSLGVGLQKSRNDRCRGLTGTGRVDRQETPHDIIAIFVVTNNPCSRLSRHFVHGINGNIPITVSDGLVEASDVLVICKGESSCEIK